MALIDPLLFRREPFRSIYLAYVAATMLAYRFPLFVLLALPPFRPRKSWSFQKALRLRLTRYINTQVVSVTGPLKQVPNSTAIPSDFRPHNTGVWIEPVDDNLIRGSLKHFASLANVKPVRIPGYWYYRKGKVAPANVEAAAGERVVLNFHGGGYVAQSAHPGDPTANIPRGVLDSTGPLSRILSVEYRLSKGKPLAPLTNPFPAALLDAVSAYSYLVKRCSFQPANIIVMGDSAGANLCLALTRYLVEASIPELSVPGGLILLSPWCDLGNSHGSEDCSMTRFADTDFLGPIYQAGQLGYAVKAYIGVLGEDGAEKNPYISPASRNLSSSNMDGLFRGFPRTLVISGGAEQLLDSIHTLRDRMKDELGDRLVYVELADSFHDSVVFPWALPERKDALDVTSKWLQTKL